MLPSQSTYYTYAYTHIIKKYIKVVKMILLHVSSHEAKSYHSFHHSCPDTLGQGQCLHNL